MTRFEALFGIKRSLVQKTCVIFPVIQKEMLTAFKAGNISKGKLYGTAEGDGFTIIHTGMNAGLAGDAVLYLKEAGCKNIILFGSCGLARSNGSFGLGSLVTPSESYSYESFSSLMEGNYRSALFRPDAEFLSAVVEAGKEHDLKKVKAATISSLKLEEDMLDSFIQKGIEVFDMESSAVFSAANRSGIRAVALFYVSDVVKEKPFYEETDKTLLSGAIKNAGDTICAFIKTNLIG